MTGKQRRGPLDLAGMLAAPPVEAEPALEVVLGDPKSRSSESAPPDWRKFTMRNLPDDHDRAERVTDDVVARSGIRAVKSMRADVIRALFEEAERDSVLRDAVAARLRDGTPP